MTVFPLRHWRTAVVTPLGEIRRPVRMTGRALRLTVTLVVTVYLWRALYAGTATSAGLDRDQAVSYAALAVLINNMRGLDRYVSQDTVLQHVRSGTIVFWFLRPISVRRYYLLRAVGDQLYGLAWVAAGYAVCLGLGVIDEPVTVPAAVVFLVSQGIGQIIVHYLLMIIDLLCFWTVMNVAATFILRFVQNLFSGSFAPLWFFPAWFRQLSDLLPFQATLNLPVSVYIGRIPVASAAPQIAVQVGWVLALAGITRLLWSRAARRVVVHGG